MPKSLFLHTGVTTVKRAAHAALFIIAALRIG